MRAQNYDSPEETELAVNNLSSIKTMLELLLKIRDHRAIASVAKLLSVSIESRNFDVMSECMDFLIKCGEESLDIVLENYNARKYDIDQRGVWLEILVKLGIKNDKIAAVLEGHLKLNIYEAVLAIGDYKSKDFIPIIEGIAAKTAASLHERSVNPFQSNVRVWDREADLYIEARSALVELQYDATVGNQEYELKLRELDSRMLPHIDLDCFYRERDELKKKLCKHGCENWSDETNLERFKKHSREEYLSGCLERVFSGVSGAKSIAFTAGYLRGIACAGAKLDINDCVKILFGGNGAFDDENHYNEAVDILHTTFEYYSNCIALNKAGRRIKPNEKAERSVNMQANEICCEIYGFLDGIKKGLEYSEKRIETDSSGLYDCFQGFYGCLQTILQEKFESKSSGDSFRDVSRISLLEDEFYKHTLSIAKVFTKNNGHK